jgi:hypothetical protein
LEEVGKTKACNLTHLLKEEMEGQEMELLVDSVEESNQALQEEVGLLVLEEALQVANLPES